MEDFFLQFFLRVDDLLLTFPVNPEELEINKSINYDTYANLNKQEILKLQEEQLLEIDFTSILEHQITNLSVSPDAYTPKTYMDFFNALFKNRKEVRLVSSDGMLDMMCFVTAFNNSYSYDNGKDYAYSLTFKENRDIVLASSIDNSYAQIPEQYIILGDRPTTNPTVTTQNQSTAASKPNTTATSTPKSQSYTVKSGDTLSSIARKFYNNSSKWTKIYDANKKVIGGNPNLIKPGQKLTIPA